MTKVVQFLGTSRRDLSEFPDNAKAEAGHQIWRVQIGLDPNNWKPFPTVGKGVREIKIRQEGQFRIFYLMQLEETVYVIHAFQKKSAKTAKADVDLAKTRYKQLMDAKNDQ
jgi:phage-related protein